MPHRKVRGSVRVRHTLLSASAFVALVSPAAVTAQTADPAPGVPATGASPGVSQPPIETASNEGQLETIVVTGQKRAGSVDVQRASLAVTAVTGQAIEDNFIANIRDVGRLAPNVQLATSGSFASYASFFIRGIGLNSTVRTVDPAVGLFVDGTYIGYGPESLPDTFDVASIEVMRGPQGTLFGKNVVGGAVVMEHQRPTRELEGRGQITLGNYDERKFAGAINLPITGETLAFRIAAVKHDRDGYWKNLQTGNHLAGIDTLEVRPALRWRPTSRLDITLSGEYVKDQSGTVATENADSRVNPRRVGANFVPTPALAQVPFGYTPPADKYKIDLDTEGNVDADVKAVRLNSDLDLGHGTVTLLTSYRRVHFDNTTDFDGTPFVLLTFNDNHEVQRQKSAELRYASRFSDIIEFTAGGYYYDSKVLVNERRDTYAGGPVSNPTISRTAYVANEHDKSAAVFVQGRIRAAEGLYGVFGGRYSDERKAIDVCPFNAISYANRNAACPLTILSGKLKSTGFTPKLGIDWQVTDRVFTYVSATKGLRSGAFNARATNLPSLGPARDESVWSYEGGVKSELFDRHLRANAAVFYADYTNIQRSIATTIFLNGVPTNSTFLQNAASGRIYGFELDMEFVPTRGLILNGSTGYTNAAYKRIIGVDADRNGTYVPAIDDPLALNLKFERVPRWSYNVGASYEFEPTAQAKVTLRTNYSWRSSQFVDTINSPAVAIPSYGLLDASVSIATPDDRYRISIFGNNLADKEFADLGFDGGPYRTISGGQPRVFGVELAAKF